MDCTTLLAGVEHLLQDTLTDTERVEARQHLSKCPRCREIVDVLRTDLAFLSVGPPAGLTESILDRTSGRGCHQVRARLGDLVDGGLAGLDQDLVRGHLAACPACAAWQGAFEWLRDDLPAFAELRPDSRLADDVMAVTGRPRRPRFLVGQWVWSGLASRLLRRTRLAWEVGYVGAAVLWLLCGPSWAPLRAAPPQVLAVVQANHVGSAVEALTATLSDDERGSIWTRVWTDVRRILDERLKTEG